MAAFPRLVCTFGGKGVIRKRCLAHLRGDIRSLLDRVERVALQGRKSGRGAVGAVKGAREIAD